jgi:hypothetical protein
MSDHLHIFVDEAGDPTLFGTKRGSGVIAGNEGSSSGFQCSENSLRLSGQKSSIGKIRNKEADL